ncbi:hypothetical protein D1871_06805 [Nakamurella silvestris]|nr:hypothetical protein D1871_06805 [Nakamurella silvestris]
MGLGFAAVALVISGVPHALASPVPTMKDLGGSRTVTVDLVSMYIHDDGDKGSPCGEGEISMELDDKVGHLTSLYVDAPKWPHKEKWCSDSYYPISAGNPHTHDVLFLQTGSELSLSGVGIERDIFRTGTFIGGDATVLIPTKGQSVVKDVDVEGNNNAGHVRITMRVKVTTF